MQMLVFWLDQERVTACPERTLVELAEKLSEGVPSDEGGGGELGGGLFAATETEAERVMLPPGPLQVKR